MARFAPPAAQGLYDPAHEKDACGTGFVAQKDGKPSHEILRKVLTALANLAHRGAVSADGLTGDGAGVLTQIPYRMLRRELRAWGKDPGHDRLAVGMFFLPKEAASCDQAMRLTAEQFAAGPFEILGWREVPISPQSLGEGAYATLPVIRQLLLKRPEGMDDIAAERQLYLIRRRIESRVERAGVSGFYIPSLSCRTVVYKGLMVASQLDRFYLDLADPDFETAIALFHQRYSTNTFPSWSLAQPFRRLAHNGEINTLRGNLNRMKVREPALASVVWGNDLDDVRDPIQRGGSDSAALDNVLEMLSLSGRDILHSSIMLVPEAYRKNTDLSDELQAFYEYHHLIAEPWDGPAALAFTDGRFAACCLDRNGLRPMRYWLMADGTVIAGSEAGVVPVPDAQVEQKGRLGPGKMLAVDTQTGRVMFDEEIKREIARRKPYRQWRDERLRWRKELHDPGVTGEGKELASIPDDLTKLQKAFGWGTEDLERILEPMAVDAKEPVGSMGDDTPIAAFSRQPQLLYRYFKQKFAQVTNPPIDPLRERVVMSLNTAIGVRPPFLDDEPGEARLFKFSSPIITSEELNLLLNSNRIDERFQSAVLRCRFPASAGPKGLEEGLKWLCDQAEREVDKGCDFLILSDREIGPNFAPIPMLLAVSAVHHHLIAARKRMRPTIICDSGEVREDHQFACLIGYSAALVHPYLAFASVHQLAAERLEKEKAAAELARENGTQIDPGAGRRLALTPEQAKRNYQQAVEKGLLKIMSKMGISTISSYRGAQTFEILGLAREVVERYFPGTDHRLSGVTLEHLAGDVFKLHREACGEAPRLQEQGLFRFTSHNGEFHAFNPGVYKSLHKAVRENDQKAFGEFLKAADEHPPANIRDLLTWKETSYPIPIEVVERSEPIEEILERFTTQAMSHGALSREAHETLSIAMNRVRGKSNSGEGGEDRLRYTPYARDMPELSFAKRHPRQGELGNSAIKQIASGRFGVTPEYVMSARELEIKMAQGSKPGEGGQIPGFKVSGEIARIRRAVPGTTLISPPPHHDIYSIEDLAQLIHDLKRTNAKAAVCVKLVSTVGIGTIAAGVAKGYADRIQISGCDGGTGASPLSSIRNAGLPWELGLAEVQQTLVLNDLRGRIRLRVDGGIRSARDVVIAALLGAEEFGFGTVALVAAGCMMARKCHLNTCPVGVASQNPELRKKFPGTPEHIINFLTFTAREIQHIMARIGVRKFEDLIGHVEMLEQRRDVALPRPANFDYQPILHNVDPARQRARRSMQDRNERPGFDLPLDEVIHRELKSLVPGAVRADRQFWIRNRERSVGSRLSGEIARVHHDRGLPEGTLTLRFHGTAGQSFGLFCNRGMTLILEGEAQDYVGKGMYGGAIVLRPPQSTKRDSHRNVIAGNTLLYGATGGLLLAAGKVGERLAVRNSGAIAVVEGCGDHGCEYMTGGAVVVLGETGRNFAAGMSGGLAFVFDPDRRFSPEPIPGIDAEGDGTLRRDPPLFNTDMVDCLPLESTGDEADVRLVEELLRLHLDHTGSAHAERILADWPNQRRHFWKLSPRPESTAAVAPADGSPVSTPAQQLLDRIAWSTGSAESSRPAVANGSSGVNEPTGTEMLPVH
jgi:glutamate synthase domain-containing protein 2/glutamate synthase domain-containing protein 1/glutamate synthase domain-containing protein 3